MRSRVIPSALPLAFSLRRRPPMTVAIVRRNFAFPPMLRTTSVCMRGSRAAGSSPLQASTYLASCSSSVVPILRTNANLVLGRVRERRHDKPGPAKPCERFTSLRRRASEQPGHSEADLHPHVHLPPRHRRGRLAEERRRHDARVADRVDVVEQVRRRRRTARSGSACSPRRRRPCRRADRRAPPPPPTRCMIITGPPGPRRRRPLAEPERVAHARGDVPHALRCVALLRPTPAGRSLNTVSPLSSRRW